MTFKLRLRGVALSLTLLLSINSLTSTAHADSFEAFFGEQDGLFAISKKRDKTFMDAGITYMNRAPFVGSEETENLVLPFVRADYKGRLFICLLYTSDAADE